MKSDKKLVGSTVGKKTWRDLFILIGIGLMYLVWIRFTGLAIPCPIRTITKLYCPGCGITRMFISISKLNFLKAFQQNALVFILLPYGIFSYLRHHLYKRLYGRPYIYGKRHTVAYLIILIMAIIFTILRNLPYMAYLRP